MFTESLYHLPVVCLRFYRFTIWALEKEKVDDLLLPWHHQNHRYAWESKNGCRELVSLLLPHIYIILYLRYLPYNVNTRQYQTIPSTWTMTKNANCHTLLKPPPLFGGRKFLKTIVIEASDTCTAESLKAWSPGNPKQQRSHQIATQLPTSHPKESQGHHLKTFHLPLHCRFKAARSRLKKKCRQRYRIRSLLRGKTPVQWKKLGQCYKIHNVFQPSNNSKSIGMKMASRWRRKRDLRQWLTFGPLSQSSNCLESCVQNPGLQTPRISWLSGWPPWELSKGQRMLHSTAFPPSRQELVAVPSWLWGPLDSFLVK